MRVKKIDRKYHKSVTFVTFLRGKLKIAGDKDKRDFVLTADC